MGYNDFNSITNMGTMFFGFVFYSFVLPLIPIFYLIGKKAAWQALSLLTQRGNKVYAKLCTWFLWNPLIRFIIEGYIEFCIDGFLNMQKLQYNNKSDVLGSMMAMICTLLSVLFPFFIFGFLIWNRPRLLHHDFEKKYGALYENITVSYFPALMFHVLFVVRRLVFTITAIYLENYSFAQVQLMILFSLIVMIYNGSVKPFEDPFFDKLEVFNEVTIIIICYHLLLFTDYMPDVELQSTFGLTAIAFTGFNMFVNMTIIFVNAFKQIKMTVNKLVRKFKMWRDKKMGRIQKYQQPEMSDTEKEATLGKGNRYFATDVKQMDKSGEFASNEHAGYTGRVGEGKEKGDFFEKARKKHSVYQNLFSHFQDTGKVETKMKIEKEQKLRNKLFSFFGSNTNGPTQNQDPQQEERALETMGKDLNVEDLNEGVEPNAITPPSIIPEKAKAEEQKKQEDLNDSSDQNDHYINQLRKQLETANKVDPEQSTRKELLKSIFQNYGGQHEENAEEEDDEMTQEQFQMRLFEHV